MARRVSTKTGATAPSKGFKTATAKGRGGASAGPGSREPQQKPQVVAFNEATVKAINDAGPKGHEVAHINPREGRLLKALGGSGEKDPETKIKSYEVVGNKKGKNSPSLPKGKGRGRFPGYEGNHHQVAVLTDPEVEALNTLRWADKDRGFVGGFGPEIQALAAQNDRPFEFLEYRGEKIPTLNGGGADDDMSGSEGDSEGRQQIADTSGGDSNFDWAAYYAGLEEKRIKKEKEEKEKEEREKKEKKEKEERERKEREEEYRRKEKEKEEKRKEQQLSAEEKRLEKRRERKEKEKEEKRIAKEEEEAAIAAAEAEEENKIEKQAEEDAEADLIEEEYESKANREDAEGGVDRGDHGTIGESGEKVYYDTTGTEGENYLKAVDRYYSGDAWDDPDYTGDVYGYGDDEDTEMVTSSASTSTKRDNFDDSEEGFEPDDFDDSEEGFTLEDSLNEDLGPDGMESDGTPIDETDRLGGDSHDTEGGYNPDLDDDFEPGGEGDDTSMDQPLDEDYFPDDREPGGEGDDTSIDETNPYDPSKDDEILGGDTHDGGGTSIDETDDDPTNDLYPDWNQNDDNEDGPITDTDDTEIEKTGDPDKDKLLADLEDQYKKYGDTDYEKLYHDEFSDDLQEDYEAASKGLDYNFLTSGDRSEFNTAGNTVNDQHDYLGELLEGEQQFDLDTQASNYGKGAKNAIQDWYEKQQKAIKDGTIDSLEPLDLSEWDDPSENYDPEFFGDKGEEGEILYDKRYYDPSKTYYDPDHVDPDDDPDASHNSLMNPETGEEETQTRDEWSSSIEEDIIDDPENPAGEDTEIYPKHEPSQAEIDYYAGLESEEGPEVTQEHLDELQEEKDLSPGDSDYMYYDNTDLGGPDLTEPAVDPPPGGTGGGGSDEMTMPDFAEPPPAWDFTETTPTAGPGLTDDEKYDEVDTLNEAEGYNPGDEGYIWKDDHFANYDDSTGEFNFGPDSVAPGEEKIPTAQETANDTRENPRGKRPPRARDRKKRNRGNY